MFTKLITTVIANVVMLFMIRHRTRQFPCMISVNQIISWGAWVVQ